jgi:hypothetical protein
MDDEHGGRVLIELDSPINYRGVEWSYLVGVPRHRGDSVSKLQTGESVVSALTGITSRQAISDNPCDTRSWRGGLAFVGDLRQSSTP